MEGILQCVGARKLAQSSENPRPRIRLQRPLSSSVFPTGHVHFIFYLFPSPNSTLQTAQKALP